MNQPGVYGTLGVQAASNVPGARANPASWTDSSGDFWLFGGEGTGPTAAQGHLNDLWKYEPATNMWTWTGGSNVTEQPGVYGTLGVPAAGNIPGARWQAASWTDASGNFWLFGGEGRDSTGTSGILNDLWRYSGGQWTWMGGPNTFCETPATFGCPGAYGTQGIPAADNGPGARSEAASWTDSCGNLWLFGGEGSDSLGAGGLLSDLWRYDPATNMWTWMSGANIVNQNGTYGTLGMASPGNMPGSRTDPVTWVDSSGNLWLFSGEGSDVNGIVCAQDGICELNDLWKYDPATNIWTWMGGSNVADEQGVYGTLGTPASGNVPGARWEAVSWIDAQGHFWLFGGFGFDSHANPEVYGDLNDLWKYDLSTNLWTWMSGSNLGDQPATYGTLGTAAPGNVPPAREWAPGWTDKSGNLWLFGGYNQFGSPSGVFNDLWKYQP